MCVLSTKSSTWSGREEAERLKGTVPMFFLLKCTLIVGLEMVLGVFQAPRLGRKAPQKRNFGVKWLRDANTRGAYLLWLG